MTATAEKKAKRPRTEQAREDAAVDAIAVMATHPELSKPAPDPTITMVLIEHLIPTPDNPRFKPSPAALKELAANIAKVGILQPVLARPHPKHGGKYDLRFGHRRLEAARMAGLDAIPCIVRDMTDAEAMEATVLENAHREDLHPLEEAIGFARLRDAGMAIENIAGRMGRSVAVVTRRLKLATLTPTWQKIIRAGGVFAEFPVGHLELIARLPAEQQDRALKELQSSFDIKDGLVPMLEDLRHDLQGGIRNLNTAPWKLDDELLLPEAGACMQCPKRSSQEPLLFEDLAEDKKQKAADHCLDQACWERKLVKHVTIRRVAAEQEGAKVQLMHSGAISYDEKKPLDKAFRVEIASPYGWRPCKKTEKGAVLAITVHGERAGSEKWVVKERSDPGRVRSVSRSTKKRTPKESLHARRGAWVVDQFTKALDKAGKDCNVEPYLGHRLEAFVYTFGLDFHRMSDASSWRAFDNLARQPRTEMTAKLLQKIVAEQTAEFVIYGREITPAIRQAMERTAELLDIDLDAIEAEALEKFPEPAAKKAAVKSPAKSKPVRTAKPDKAAAGKPRQAKVKKAAPTAAAKPRPRAKKKALGKGIATTTDDGDDDGGGDVAACILCACTEDTPCPGGCRWVLNDEMVDLCSRCEDKWRRMGAAARAVAIRNSKAFA